MLKWFEGNVPEAIAEKTAKEALLIVFVHDSSEDSNQLRELLSGAGVSAAIIVPYVALQLESESAAAKQFSEFYPLFMVPCVYFVGKTGEALEVVLGLKTNDELVEFITKAVSKFTSSSPSQTATSSDSPSSSNAVPLEERVAAAKDQLARKRDEKMVNEFEKEKERELQRRNMGKGLSELKALQKEREHREAAAEREKDKAAEKAYKEKIKRDIERDRLERQQVYYKQKSESAAKQQEAEEATTLRQRVVDEDKQKQAKIQFRYPDGSTHTQQFDSSQTLKEVIAAVKINTRRYRIGVAFPRVFFESTDFSRTLAELNLVPSSALILVPQLSTTTADGGYLSVFYSIFAILASAWTWICARVSPQPAVTSAASNRTHNASTSNVNRFRNTDDDKDDNATWNGNSTQQM